MLGYVLSLSLMVALANLPFGEGWMSLGNAGRFSLDGPVPSESIPVITIMDVQEAEPGRRHIERFDPRAELPDAEIDFSELEPVDDDGGRSSLAAESVPVLKPASIVASATLIDLSSRSKSLRYVVGPPTVEESPKLRVSSMIIKYPLSALKRAIQGLVIVQFTVETNGRASAVRVVHGLDPACDREVVQAIRDARFIPGRSKGREVPAHSQMTVRFVLADS